MKKIKNLLKVLFAMVIAISLGGLEPVEASSDSLVIYEAYGGGGNSGATFKNDYVVLKNVSNVDQSLDGLYVHRASSKSWQDSVKLNGTLKPGQYYLIEAQEGFNKDAKALPRTGDVKAPDMGIAAKNFAIALTRSADAPSSTNTIDLLGAGSATLKEGSPSKAAANNVSIRRVSDIDTDNNANDFETITHEAISLDYLNNDESTTDPENPGDEEEPSAPEIDPSTSLVIYEIFKGGARDGSIYKNDYIVVKNISSEPVSLQGKRLQAYKWYSSGYKWGSVYRFPNQSLEPGDYFVITGNKGSGKTSQNLEVPNGNHSLLMWNQKDYALAITNDGEDPTLSNTIDIVGDEKSGKYEGEPAPNLSNNYSIRRVEGKDTNNNKNDFTVINHDDYKESEEKPLDYLNKKEDTKEISFEVDATKGTVEGETKITVNVDATEEEILKNAPMVTGKNGHTFIKWNKTNDDTYTAEFEAPHGKVEVHFITGTYINEKFENRKYYTQLTGEQLNGASFNVVNLVNQNVTEAKRYLKLGKDVLAVGPQLGTGLGRGDYQINITPPEGYEISAIKRYAKTDAETIENGSIVTLPIKESPDRITNPEVLYVEVKKAPQSYTVKVNGATGEYAETEVKENEKYTVQTAKSYNLLANEDEELVGYEIIEGSLKDKDKNILSVGDIIQAPANAWSKPQFEVLSDVVLEPVYKTTSGIIEIEVRDDDVTENPESYKFTLVDNAGNEYELNSTSKSSDGDGKFRIYSYRQPTIGDGEKLESGAYTLQVSNTDGRVIKEVDVRTRSFNNVESHNHSLEDGKAKLNILFGPQTGANPKVRFVVRLTEKNVEPTSRTINFVVDPEKGLATGALFVEVIEGEDQIAKAPKVEAKEGYNFVRWEASEDRLTYTAIFEEDAPKEPEINYNYKVTLTDRNPGSNIVKYLADDHEKVVFIVNGNYYEQTPELIKGQLYKIELNENLNSGDKIEFYIQKDNQISKPIRQRIR